MIGVALPDVSDWVQAHPAGKWSQFFAALAERVSLLEVLRPRLSPLDEIVEDVRSFRPEKAAWLARSQFNARRLAKRNASLREELAPQEGSYDILVQLQTLCAPGRASEAPYAIYTDNTMALTARTFPRFAPLSPSMLRQWLAFEGEVCRNAEAVFTFSQFARGSMIEDYGCAPERVLAVGAGANQYADPLPVKDYSRPRALFVGRPFEPKGGRILLEAWRIVRRAIPDAQLVIAGPRRAPKLPPGGGVTFIGRVDRAELARQYLDASVFVLPSLFDAWGHVFVEAMGNGLPCIGTDCCAMPEIIEHDVSGLLVSRGQAEPLAGALIELLSDGDQAARMGRAGHERAMRDLLWGHVADRVVEHLTTHSRGAGEP